MSTLGGIDDISNDFPVTVLILDHGYNTHSPPVIVASVWGMASSCGSCGPFGGPGELERRRTARGRRRAL
jgi:hypothetical protein